MKVAVLALFVALAAGCGGGSKTSQNDDPPAASVPRMGEVAIVEVYRPKWDEYVECAVATSSDWEGGAGVALDCNWP